MQVAAQLLWNEGVTAQGRGGGSGLVTVGGGVASSVGEGFVILDGDGQVVRAVSTSTGDPVSAPAVGADGSLYFSDLTSVFRVSPSGDQVWKSTLGTLPDSPNEFRSPGDPLVDATGHVLVSGQDGNLYKFNDQDGTTAGIWKMGSTGPYRISAGVSDVVFIGIQSVSPPNAISVFSTASAAAIGTLSVGSAQYPTSVLAVGFDLGIVATAYLDSNSEKVRTTVFDPCGVERRTVPGDFAFPLLVGFDDELLVEDLVPKGAGQYDVSLRRFSKDGVLLAGPLPLPGPRSRSFVLGADGIVYSSGIDQKTVIAIDWATLEVTWSLPIGVPVGPAVLGASGKLFFGCGSKTVSADVGLVTMLQFCAVQTPSPGQARVSWGRTQRRDDRSSSWLAP
jgi:hypothetical protein